MILAKSCKKVSFKRIFICVGERNTSPASSCSMFLPLLGKCLAKARKNQEFRLAIYVTRVEKEKKIEILFSEVCGWGYYFRVGCVWEGIEIRTWETFVILLSPFVRRKFWLVSVVSCSTLALWICTWRILFQRLLMVFYFLSPSPSRSRSFVQDVWLLYLFFTIFICFVRIYFG